MKQKKEINIHLICPNWKVICCSLWREWGGGGRCNGWRSPLEGKPGVAQALCGRGSLLWDQLQHGEQEVGEALGFLTGPLVFVDQHLQQAPRLQLGDVFQIACGQPPSYRQTDRAASEPCTNTPQGCSHVWMAPNVIHSNTTGKSLGMNTVSRKMGKLFSISRVLTEASFTHELRKISGKSEI